MEERKEGTWCSGGVCERRAHGVVEVCEREEGTRYSGGVCERRAQDDVVEERGGHKM